MYPTGSAVSSHGKYKDRRRDCTMSMFVRRGNKNVGYIPVFYIGLYIASQVVACGGLVSGARTQR